MQVLLVPCSQDRKSEWKIGCSCRNSGKLIEVKFETQQQRNKTEDWRAVLTMRAGTVPYSAMRPTHTARKTN